MSARPYRVDGEVGRFSFQNYEAHERKSGSKSNCMGPVFSPLSGKSWYRTQGFKELGYVHGASEDSYRKSTQWLNRLRHQVEGGTPFRSLQDGAQREGSRVLTYLERKSKEIFKDHGFSEQGVPIKSIESYQRQPPAHLPPTKVAQAIERCGKSELMRKQMRANPVGYEDPHHSVNISLDDVGVKRQQEHRLVKPLDSKTSRKYVYQTVTHIETQTGYYRFNAVGVSLTLSILVAFLLHNDLLQGNLQVFADGQKTLHDGVLTAFAWFTPLQLILDWYHLHEKGKIQLSLACNGRESRNRHLARLMTLLWHGLVDEALLYLDYLDPNDLKNVQALEQLKTYLRRNRSHIPCYSVRKYLGLRNSSNLGEKSNDLLVSARQKHNGMSWSKMGSAALAAITALVYNKEYPTWFRTGELNFRLVSRTVG